MDRKKNTKRRRGQELENTIAYKDEKAKGEESQQK